ncbi:hypothetical protein GTQ40_10740 [Flavobacteriaceae bacterium R38]|nr:hypothetical protein [Flavobacteriaceae bacterium R38]
MNVSDFTSLLQNPEALTIEHANSLEKILEEYPFFQAGKALYLKGLKDFDSFKYNEALKRTAAYTTDRSVLFNFITSEEFSQNNIAKNIPQHEKIVEDIHVEAEEIVEVQETDLGKQKDAEAILDPSLFEKKEIVSLEEDEDIKALELGKPLEFDSNEQHSFSEWLKLAQAKPIIRKEEIKKETSSDDKKRQKFALIDKFIEENPKINPSKDAATTINLAKQNLVEKSELMTETLARIYLEQRKYKKALQAYKILSLKYPEKSGFFADQIRAVKKLQQNN